MCNRIGVESGDRLAPESRKRKFLVLHVPDDSVYPKFQDFIVAHDYLVTPNSEKQARIRRRGQNGSSLFYVILIKCFFSMRLLRTLSL